MAPRKKTKPTKKYLVTATYKDEVKSIKVDATDETEAEAKAMLWASETYRFPVQRTEFNVLETE